MNNQPTLLTPAQSRLALVILGVFAIGWVFSLLSNALSPFIAAALLAYACDPLVDRLEARGIGRAVGSALVIMFLGVLILGLLMTVIPLFVELSGRITTRVPLLLDTLQTQTLPWIKQKFGLTIQLDLPHLQAFAAKHARQIESLTQAAMGTAMQSGKILLNLSMMGILVPVVMYYLLVDWDHLMAKIDALIPHRWTTPTREIAREIDQVLGQFLRGQGSVMLTLACYYAIALTIAGVDFSLPVGLLTGLLIFIPYLGFSLGFTLALLTAALQGGDFTPVLAVIGIYGAGQLLESFVLTPWLVGERIGLHPVVVIFALLAFGQLFGLVGMLLALPAAAAILVALRAARRHYLDSDFYKNA